jgi:hypothetical protein
MTVEVAIMNKSAVALAADSILTINTKGKEKTFNKTKIDELSGGRPVGIMHYGADQLMGVPWNMILEIYKQELGAKHFDRLQDYGDDFIEFLSSNRTLGNAFDRNKAVEDTILFHFFTLWKAIQDEAMKALDSEGEITKKSARRIIRETIEIYGLNLSLLDVVPAMKGMKTEELMKKFRTMVVGAKGTVFQEMPLSSQDMKKLKQIVSHGLTRELVYLESLGVVIAGYGDREIYPSIISFEVDGLVDDRLRYRRLTSNAISKRVEADIQAFAQKEVVEALIYDFDLDLLQETVGTFITTIYDFLFEHSDIIQQNEFLEAFQLDLLSALPALQDDFFTTLKKDLHEKYRQPVLDIVKGLPERELAKMASVLVQMTAFKAKFSSRMGIIGDEADVAVITKGGGFEWLKPEVGDLFGNK